MAVAGIFESPVSKPAKVNFFQSLIAVVAGNVVYFLLMPHLPPAARHNPMKLDLGVLVDFWFCLVFLGAIKTFTRWGRNSRQQQRR
jgi:hypothetical protein